MEEYTLSDESRTGYGNSIFVSDGDVYVTGGERNGTKSEVAVVWKNGSKLYDLTEDAHGLRLGYSIYVVKSEEE